MDNMTLREQVLHCRRLGLTFKETDFLITFGTDMSHMQLIGHWGWSGQTMMKERVAAQATQYRQDFYGE